jgi:hypothetical protein
MAKLKNIIKQLSAADYQSIHDSLMQSNAEKSAHLLKFIRERQMSDAKVMEELDVNTNAYYTLRSRLNQKIEEYLLAQMESPRTDLLKKVANINDVVFSKKRAIASATLKKLEKELLDYDLANELTIVYKTLKKLHINTPDHFAYSQQYNRHVAYMLAMDKAEDLVAEYFKKYGQYFMSGSDVEKFGLEVLYKEIANVCNLYQSHRLYVYFSMVNVYHRLFVNTKETDNEDEEPIEDILLNIDKLFEDYSRDSIYYNLNIVFEFLKLEYYNFYKVFRKAERYYDEVNFNAGLLLANYNLYTFPPQFLLSKIDRAVRTESEGQLYEENKTLFADYELDLNDIPRHIVYIFYRSVCCYYSEKYDEAARYLNNLINDLSLKKYPQAQVEIKLFLALQYCLLNDYDLFNQCINSIQRSIRISDKSVVDHVQIFIKILKTALGDNKKAKPAKIKGFVDKLRFLDIPHFSSIKHIRMDERFINKLSGF